MKQADKALAREILQRLLSAAKVDTMRSIYERIAPGDDGCIRSVLNPGGTETGRMSHSETFLERSTNLANLPNKTAQDDPLYRVRDCLVPHEGRIIGKADFSQAEARWCAWLAGDTVRIQMYADGVDQYKYFMAALKWDDPSRLEEIGKWERQIGKVGILAGQYSVSWRKLMDTVNADADLTGVAIDAKTAKRMVDIWPELFPRTVEWWSEVREEVLSKGYLTNPFGRRRDFFGRTDGEAGRAAVVREAIAYGPQSANADALNTAIRELYEKYDPHLLRILLNVHDEIVFDCCPADIMRAVRVVQQTMEFPVEVNGRTLVVPAEVSISSKSWAEMRQVA